MGPDRKWSKITDQKFEQYKKLVECFLLLKRTKILSFHCITFDNHCWNHSKYNDGDRDIGLSKLYYQLILHKFVRSFGNSGTCCACLDQRLSSTSLGDLKNMVNNALSRDYQIKNAPLRQVLSNDSKNDDVLQLNDVILGAVGAVTNRKHLNPTGRYAKRAIAELVLRESGLSTFESNSNIDQTEFSVWKFKPQNRHVPRT